ncbi:MAG TPA: creatininase family protein [Candidatus Acidoferrum sp.]|nr:creatininase family protein [Candidatus Acidoferrum sp.]
MTVKLVREYLQQRRSIIMPLGVIEQHGYHLPLCTDALIAGGVARLIGLKTGVLVAPTMYESFSGGDLPGTINITPATMAHVVSDRLVSLAAQGFRHFHLFLCHGGSENARALKDAIQINLRLNPVFEKAMVTLFGIWDCDPHSIAWRKAVREGDWHAGWLETSMVMALRPDLVRMRDMELDEEHWLRLQMEHPDNYQHAQKIVDDRFVMPLMKQRPQIKVGVMGDPKRASAELGHKMIADAVEFASKRIAALEAKADGIYKEVAFKPLPIIFEE